MASRVKLKVLNGAYGVTRLRSSDPIPAWADGSGFVSISHTDDELSIVMADVIWNWPASAVWVNGVHSQKASNDLT